MCFPAGYIISSELLIIIFPKDGYTFFSCSVEGEECAVSVPFTDIHSEISRETFTNSSESALPNVGSNEHCVQKSLWGVCGFTCHFVWQKQGI